MKIQVSETTPLQLNWLVAKAEGKHLVKLHKHFESVAKHPGMSDTRIAQHLSRQPDIWVWLDNIGASQHIEPYCTAWSQGGPIIEREELWLTTEYGQWVALSANFKRMLGPTPLIAAMRCFVVSKLGDEVEIPEELA